MFLASAIIYAQSFTSGSTSVSQCTAWDNFRVLLVSSSYTSLMINGTNDPRGITLTNSVMVNAIAQALRTNTTYGPVSSNGYSWMVGPCGGGYELTTTGSTCNCNTGYTLRPCIGNYNWGGINNATCGASRQTMTIIIM